MTLQLEFDQLHGDGELVDVHATIAVHVGQSPGNTRETQLCSICVRHICQTAAQLVGHCSQCDSPDLSQDGRGQA